MFYDSPRSLHVHYLVLNLTDDVTAFEVEVGGS